MAVPQETFGPADVRLTGRLAEVFDLLTRRPDGTYSFRLRVDGEAVLADGRRVRIDRHVGLEANECVGRRSPRRSA